MNQPKSQNFAAKLQYILDNHCFNSIIGWSDNNTAIEVLDSLRMEQQILPIYFRQSKYESFIRQLNLYGFKKMKCHSSNKFTHQLLREGQQVSSISTIKKAQKKLQKTEDNVVNTEQKCKFSHGQTNEGMGELQNKGGVDKMSMQNASSHAYNGSNHSQENIINLYQSNSYPVHSLASSIVYIPAEQYLLWNYMYNMQSNQPQIATSS